jgi:hypothetical protein
VYAGLPIIFGFSVHDSIEQSQNKNVSPFPNSSLQQDEEELTQYPILNPPGSIPFPVFSEIYRGGHAAVIVGYDDDVIIMNRQAVGRKDREAFSTYNTQAFVMRSDSLYGETATWNEAEQTYRLGGDISFSDYKFPHPEFDGVFIHLRCRHAKQTLSEELLLTPKNAFPRTRIQNSNRVAIVEHLATKGAFKIRNSWGKDWGKDGYGWLPYAYVYRELAYDFWSILKYEWMNTEDFGLLRQDGNLVMCRPGQWDQTKNEWC